MTTTSPHADLDRFFEELYERTTAPFLTPAMTAQEVASFCALTKLSPGAKVLDLGCGSGRHLAVLNALGFRAIGLDKSASLSHLAGKRGPVTRADLLHMPVRSGSLEAVACFYSSIFFFGSRDVDAVKEVARVLRPGGVFALQTASPLHLRKLGTQQMRHQFPNGDVVEELSRWDAQTQTEHGERKLTTASGEVHEGRYSVRHYAPGELEVLALRSGMRLEKTFGSLDLAPFTRESRELVVLLRKR